MVLFVASEVGFTLKIFPEMTRFNILEVCMKSMKSRVTRQAQQMISFINSCRKDGINNAFKQIDKDPSEIIPIPLIFLPKPTNWLNFFRFQKLGVLTACDIGQLLDKSVSLGHTTGIVINSRAKIGKNVHIRNNVTIGGKSGDGVPTIEDDVEIGAGAVIIGKVTVGEGAIIGANATVVSDIPPHTVAVGNPAEVIKNVEPDK